jgi:hypothetical protein
MSKGLRDSVDFLYSMQKDAREKFDNPNFKYDKGIVEVKISKEKAFSKILYMIACKIATFSCFINTKTKLNMNSFIKEFIFINEEGKYLDEECVTKIIDDAFKIVKFECVD